MSKRVMGLFFLGVFFVVVSSVGIIAKSKTMKAAKAKACTSCKEKKTTDKEVSQTTTSSQADTSKQQAK